MLRNLLISLIFITLIGVTAGFVVLGFWDVPAPVQSVEKPLDASKFLGKGL